MLNRSAVRPLHRASHGPPPPALRAGEDKAPPLRLDLPLLVPKQRRGWQNFRLGEPLQAFGFFVRSTISSDFFRLLLARSRSYGRSHRPLQSSAENRLSSRRQVSSRRHLVLIGRQSEKCHSSP